MQRTPNLGLPLNLGGHVATALALQEGFQKISEYLGVPLTLGVTGHVPPQLAVQSNFAIIEREMGIELPKDVAGHVALMQTVRKAFLLIDEEAREPEVEGGLAMVSGSGAIPISTATEGGDTVYNVVLTDAETAPDYYYLSAQGLVEMAQNGEMSPQDAWGFLAGGSFERYLMVAQSLVALPVGTVFEMPGVENVSGFTCPDPETPTDDLPRVVVTGLPDASIRYLRLCDNTAGAIGWDGGVAPDNPTLVPKPISPEGPLGIQFNFDGDYAWDRTAATFQRYAETPTVDDIIDQFGRAFREAFGNDPADPWHKPA